MSLNGNNVIGSSGHRTNQPPYEIDQSLRFNSSDDPYLSRTPSSAGNRKTFTLSFWVKKNIDTAEHGAIANVYSAGNDNDYFSIEFIRSGSNEDKLRVSGWSNSFRITDRVFRDPSAWYHIVIACDSTQATANDRLKVYVNGSQETDFVNTVNISQDANYGWNQAYAHHIGEETSGSEHLDGYLAEFYSIDGQALTPASFGETNEDTNQWQAIEYEGSYGTNGFYLKFQDSSALGDDSSGNTNDFSATNLVATDQVLDSPTNNFATLNPIYEDSSAPPANVAFAEGNLSVTGTSANFGVAYSTMTIPASGKWYLETYLDNGSLCGVGIVTASGRESVTDGWGMGAVTTAQGFGTQANYVNNSSSNNFALGTGTPSNGDIYQLAIDADNNKVWIGLNNSWNDASGGTTGNPSSGTNHTIALTFGSDAQIGFQRTNSSPNTGMVANFGQDSSFAGNKTAQGNQDGNGIGDFYYTPPTGFKALSTDNLSDPSIADPTAYFNTVAYSGNGSTQSITTGLQPDFTWIKGRSYASNHRLIDSVRGAGERLSSNLTNAETTESNGLTSFNSDGFSVGTEGGYNNSGQTFVSWNWKAGGTASSNTDGSITSSVSANTDAGFSIVSYTGNGTNGATVGHGLGVTPDAIILKNRDSTAYNDNWMVRHIGVGDVASGTAANLKLNSADAPTDSPSRGWPEITNSSVLTLVSGGSGITNCNETGDNYIAYCFHGVDGYSKVGSYTGNGSTDGTFIYTGFRPAFVLLKISSASNDWILQDNKRDTYNAVGHYLRPNTSDAELDEDSIDFLSNGFKLRTTSGARNTSSGTYIYLAFAESPFKYSNAR